MMLQQGMCRFQLLKFKNFKTFLIADIADIYDTLQTTENDSHKENVKSFGWKLKLNGDTAIMWGK